MYKKSSKKRYICKEETPAGIIATTMIKSMTGYGKAEAVLETGKLTIEIKTLNGKGADVSLKSSLLPKDRELQLRAKLSAFLVRGTVDVFLNWEPGAGTEGKVIDEALVRSYFKRLTEIRRDLPGFTGGSFEMTDRMNNELLAAILRLPDVVDNRKGDVLTEADWPAVEAAFDRALEAVDAFRLREGEALYRDVTGRVKGILALEDEVEALLPERIGAVRERLLRSLEELKQKVDPSRFEQEMVFYLEKLDINEENVRLRQHCRYFLETIDAEPFPGRKLGFIVQEMGREINTTGSKANHASIQAIVVRMKDELEKIREQCLNIL